MDFQGMRSLKSNKYYYTTKLSEHREIFNNELYLGNDTLQVTEETLSDIIRASGIPKNLSKVLRSQESELWVTNVITMCDYYYSSDVVFLVENSLVTKVTFTRVRPLLNTEFFRIMSSLLEEYEDLVFVDEFNYSTDSYESDISIFPCKSYEYQEREYRLGVMFLNNELDTVNCRLVVKTPDISFYLPSKYYSLSASRYLKTSADRSEALSQLVLRVLESISSDSWYSIIPEIDMNIRNCGKISATYEEYRQAQRLLSNVSLESDLDDSVSEEVTERLSTSFADFEKNYPLLDEKKGFYIWRCSALSENTILDIAKTLDTLAKSKIFYPESVKKIRELVGEYIMLSRISTNLAKRKQ